MKTQYHVMFDGRMISGKISGVARHLINLISGLNEISPNNKYSVIINDKNALEYFGDKVEIIWAKHKFRSPFEYFEIPKIIEQKKPDIFHSPSHSATIPDCGIPYLITIHDLINMCEQKNVFKLAYGKFMLRRSSRLADRVLTVSEYSKKQIAKILDVELNNIDVIYSAIQEKFFKKTDDNKMQEIKKKYNLPDKYILYIGRNDAYRNLKNTIDAYLKSEVEEPLVLALYWPQVQKFCPTVAKPDKIICVGPVPDSDLPYIYKASSLFLFLSLMEGFALPVVEAFASGTPAIISNVSSLPELSRGCAVEVDPTDVNGISAAIKIAMTDEVLRHRNIELGLARAQEFTSQKLAERVLKVYERVLSEHKI
ncbi:MAG: glycosyltransferase family 1 protein [bacterium]